MNRWMFAGAGGVIAAGAAWGGTLYSFTAITANSVNGPLIGAAQIKMDVSDFGGGVMAFLFTNTGASSSSITNVYFDNTAGVLGAQHSILNGAGVLFSWGGSPSDLPHGNNVSFITHFRAKADPPPSSNGVNPGESLTLRLTRAGAFSASDVINALNAGTLRVGMHITGFPGGASESFVNMPENPAIPLPAGGLLGTAGLAVLGLGRRR